MFRDRPMSPVETSIYWIEFIHRHGMDALKSPVVDMPWWQISLLDVYGFVALLSLVVLFIVAKVCKVLIELSKFKLNGTREYKIKSN